MRLRRAVLLGYRREYSEEDYNWLTDRLTAAREIGRQTMEQAPAESRRVSLSGIEVSVLVDEFRKSLIGCYVSNVYSLGETQLLKLRKGDEETTLVLSPLHGAWLSERLLTRSVTSGFTSAMRKELIRNKLEDAAQLDFDRIIFFSFSKKDSRKRLVVEFMPPGNMVVLDDMGTIRLALREYRTPQRRIVKGEKYRAPEQTRETIDSLTKDSLTRILENENKVGRALGRGLALPRKYIDEILSRAGLNHTDESPPAEEKILDIWNAIREILVEVRSPSPNLSETEGRTELLAVKSNKGRVVEEARTMSELLDIAFAPLIQKQVLEEEEEGGERKLRELEATLARLNRERSELEEKAIALREIASRLRTATSLDEANQLTERSRSLLTKELMGRVEGAGSLAAMASVIFDVAKSLKAEAGRIREAAGSLAARLEKEQKHLSREKQTRPKKTRIKKEWYEKFRWFFTSSGNLAIGGRDSQSNTLLIKRYLEETDVVYHADLFGSPFFVLKGGKKRQTEDETREVSKATVSFSSAWKTGLGSADAYWVNPDQVSSTAPSGEYLPRGSFVIRGTKNFVRNNSVRVSVGVDAEGRILSGPEEAIARTALAIVTLVPHREKGSETAKRVAFELRRMAGQEVGAKISLDDVLRMLPSGGGKIVNKKVVHETRTGTDSPSADSTRPVPKP